ncbi:hypothetical protein [Streptomyces sp. CBMA156]|uniref:hypothetical protein n=1 Tax=Streptomyces sp. CBMA156 TaxID=1930280 RepID=UPI001661F0A0|nr:hypothetical protein [Streptomyces sp. CBMA156]MBD0675653.1 hypothetical protein [Streptomyces sp. CBMA156]
MGKKAQRKRSVKAVKEFKHVWSPAPSVAAAVDAVAAQVRAAAMTKGWAALGTPWDSFTKRYPTVADAIAAAEDTGALTCFAVDDWGEYERGVRRGPDGWSYEVTLYPCAQLRDLVKTCWLSADDRDQAVEQLRRALEGYVPAALRRPEIEVVHRPSTTVMPRIGWTQRLPVTGLETWEDVHLAEKDLPLHDLATAAAGDLDGQRYTSTVLARTVALFRSHGLSAQACAGCGMAVTDRHPHWPGVWTAVDREFGPTCDRSRLARTESEQRVGHVVEEADARPAQALTGQEPTVVCRNCGAQVSDQHPDWPGTWAGAGRHSDPVCAVAGSMGGDDAGEYDLLDCVYPHVPEGADSPAAAAIAAARQARYFLQH